MAGFQVITEGAGSGADRQCCRRSARRPYHDRGWAAIDFRGSIRGVRPLASLRSRARAVAFEGAELLVADLADVTPSRRTAERPKRATRKAKLEALKKESDLALRDQIRRWRVLPPGRRTNFLHRRIAY